MRVVLSVLVLAILVAPVANAATPLDRHDSDPGHSASFALFPGHEEVQAALSTFAEHPWVTLHEVGRSAEDRAIVLAEVVNPASTVPLDQRVVTFLFTQQHGNEPAGTPAAIELLEEITTGGPAAAHLTNQVLLVLPLANPDGAHVDQRRNAQDVDINRDHIALETPEARALHHVLNTWDVHVAMDHHEYSGIGLGQPVPVRLYDADLTTLFPVHGNVAPATSDAARLLMYEGIWPYARERGFTVNEYGEVTAAGVPVQWLAGGPDPGIERNHLGLHHIAGLLVETRVDAIDNPFQDAERRTAIHRTVMDATLGYASEHAEFFRQAKADARAQTLAFPDTLYREGDERVATMGSGVLVEADEALFETLARHGLPGLVPRDGRSFHDFQHALQGHAAAALHPASSRALDPGATVLEEREASLDEPLDPAGVDGAEDIPVLGAGAVLGLVVLAAFAHRRDARHP